MGKEVDDTASNEVIVLIKNLIEVNQRLMILTPDSNIDRLNNMLNYPVQLLGVRDSKGLEFSDILLVDFFSSLPQSDSTAWRKLLDNDKEGAGEKFPQLEFQLKLLYVAITRTCNRLVFVETKPSEIATRIFKSWTHPNALVTRYNPSSETNVLLTEDESIKIGLDFVLKALDDDYSDNYDKSKSISWLEKALYYLKRTGKSDLVKRVVLQQRLLMVRNLELMRSSGHDNDINNNDKSKINNESFDEIVIESRVLSAIDHEYQVIGVIQDCIMSNMYEEAIQLMQIVIHRDGTYKEDSSYQRYLIELCDKLKTTLHQKSK